MREVGHDARGARGGRAAPVGGGHGLPSPPAVQQALLYRAAHATYGYTEPDADDTRALTDFWQRRHGLTVEADEVTMLPCVITGMKLAIRALTEPGMAW